MKNETRKTKTQPESKIYNNKKSLNPQRQTRKRSVAEAGPEGVVSFLAKKKELSRIQELSLEDKAKIWR